MVHPGLITFATHFNNKSGADAKAVKGILGTGAWKKNERLGWGLERAWMGLGRNFEHTCPRDRQTDRQTLHPARSCSYHLELASYICMHRIELPPEHMHIRYSLAG